MYMSAQAVSLAHFLILHDPGIQITRSLIIPGPLVELLNAISHKAGNKGLTGPPPKRRKTKS